jgi:hypothetical protein
VGGGQNEGITKIYGSVHCSSFSQAAQEPHGVITISGGRFDRQLLQHAVTWHLQPTQDVQMSTQSQLPEQQVVSQLFSQSAQAQETSPQRQSLHWQSNGATSVPATATRVTKASRNTASLLYCPVPMPPRFPAPERAISNWLSPPDVNVVCNPLWM